MNILTVFIMQNDSGSCQLVHDNLSTTILLGPAECNNYNTPCFIFTGGPGVQEFDRCWSQTRRSDRSVHAQLRVLLYSNSCSSSSRTSFGRCIDGRNQN